MEAELKDRERARDERKALAKRKCKDMGTKLEDVNKYVSLHVIQFRDMVLMSIQEEQAEEYKNKLDNLKKAEKQRAGQIKSLEKAIEENQYKLAHPPETENLDEIQEQIVRYISKFEFT